MDRPGATRRGSGRAAAVVPGIVAFLGLAWFEPAPGQQLRQSSYIDKRLGEEEQILRREEWFLSTRRAGTTSPAERAALRLAAVRETKVALERQKALHDAGIKALDNLWVARGPSPSTFGAWAFGNVSGRISSIAADWAGGVLYLGTASGGVWSSSNDGLSWFPLFDSAGTMTVGTLTVDPNNPAVLWVGTGENHRSCESYFGIGLLRSTDAGQTWELRNGSGSSTLEDLSSFANVVVDPRDSNHLVTGGRLRDCVSGSGFAGGIYSSNDAGATWTNRLSSTEVYEIAQDPAVLDVFWAATRQGIYKSIDNGVTWVKQTASGLPSIDTGRTELALAPSNGNVVYALFESGPSFWRTDDGGASWTQMSSGSSACDGQCSYNMVLRVDPTNPSIVYRGTIHIFKSQNGGASWSDLSNNWGALQKVHQDTHHLLMHPTTSGTFYVGSDGGVWKTVNSGSSFVNRNGNLGITQFYAVGVDAANPDLICGGAQDNSSLARTDSDVWDLQAVTGDGFVCHFDPQDPDYAFIASYPSGGYPSVWRSTSGPFGSFSSISGPGRGIVQFDRINWVTPYLLDPTNPATMYLGTHRVYRSTNHGTSWTQAGPSDLTGGSGSLIALELNRNFPTYLFSGSTSGRVWRSVDGGSAWTDISAGLPVRSVNDIAGDPADRDRALAVVGGFNTSHLWEWTASGGWVARGGNLPNVPANTVLMQTSTDVLVGTDTGVFLSNDGGQTFAPYMLGLPEGTVVTDLKYNEDLQLVTAGTYGRGAWQVSVGPVLPIVLFDSIEQPLVEIDGDGDANVEPGETWSVDVVLRNGGGQAALGVQARLASALPGVTILGSATRSFGDIAPGATATPLEAFHFVVEPSFPCGQDAIFDVVDIGSANPTLMHPGEPGAFRVTVADHATPAEVTTLFEDDFDPSPQAGWTHEVVDPGLPACDPLAFVDQWVLATQDAAHGTSYHCGRGPEQRYGKWNFAWLYPGGKDSTDGPGILLPADITAAALTFSHWYQTNDGLDGAQVLIDALEDDQDAYVTLEPSGGYPAGTLASGNCNGLEGLEAFHGESNGWTTSTFDLLPYLGRRVYLAFVFGSGDAAGGEGWYIDDVTVKVWRGGEAVCQVAGWPGSVPDSAIFDLVAPDTIEASWDDTCNAGTVAGQTYAILAGDLDLLSQSGSYSHAPVGNRCDLVSPWAFTPGAGNEYYLIVPYLDGRVGGAGTDSLAAPRPTAGACGVQRQDVCN